MPGIDLTEKLLLEIGGWREMKEARAMVAAGAVIEGVFDGLVLKGLVRSGGNQLACGLRFHSSTDIDNLCGCPRSRREGAVCAHSLAVGISVLHGAGESAPSSHPDDTGKPCDGSLWPTIADEPDELACLVRFSALIPPTFFEGWKAGSIPLMLEVEIEGCRAPAHTLERGRRYWMDDDDVVFVDWMKCAFPDGPPAMSRVTRAAFLAFLGACVGHPRITLGRDKHVVVSPSAVRVPLVADGMRLRAILPEGTLVADGSAWHWDGAVFAPVASGLSSRFFNVFSGGWVVDGATARAEVERFSAFFDVDEASLELLPEAVKPGVVCDIEGTLNGIEAALSFHYPGLDRPQPEDGAPVTYQDAGGRTRVTDPSAEAACFARLLGLGFVPSRKQGVFVLKDRELILRFFAFGLDRLRCEWKIRLRDMAAHASRQVVAIEPELHCPHGGGDWFAVEVGYAAPDGSRMDRAEVMRLLRGGTTHSKRSDGKIAVLDVAAIAGIDDAIADCAPDQIRPGEFKIAFRDIGSIAESAAVFGTAFQLPAERDVPEPVLSPRWNSMLRPYQIDGSRWLLRTAGRNGGALLADDMGLGKTVQCLAAIESAGWRTLVVAPASLVENWVAEALKFAPSLRVLAVRGGPEVRSANISSPDLVVTSYGTLREHHGVFAAAEFDLVLLDEAQSIKNPDSQAAKAARALSAKARIALTGTPVENSPADLWSILQFAVPGYLGSAAFFKERFGTGDRESMERLARRVAPVLLRRLKSEVAADLPARIEQSLPVSLTEAQRSLYADLLQAARTKLGEAKGPQKRMIALTALLRLRQVCCDPRLLGGEAAEKFSEADSAKLGLAMELVAESAASGHRVLIFSQFTSMLGLLRGALHARDIACCYLDGATRDRIGEVSRFQNSPRIPVFLISLKAGGVGLNLTAADHVVHFDPWWNPAVEAQATDRAHRIGQSRVVTSYRLVAVGTVEEKIAAVLARKRELSETVLSGVAGGWSDSELTGLL